MAAEIAVCVKAAGLTERWDLHQLAVSGPEPLLEHALAGAAGVGVPAPGRAVCVAGPWCCRTAHDRAIVAGPPAAVDRWQRVMRQAGRATGAGLSVAVVREAAALSIVGPRAAEVMAAAELHGHELADRGVATGLLAGCRVSVLREDRQRFLLLCADGCSEAARAALWRAGSGLGIAHVADAVPAAAEAEPYRQAGLQQARDGVIGRIPHQRERLEQDEVGPLLLEQAGEQVDRLRALGTVHVPVRLKATAQSDLRPARSTASRARSRPRRATSIQCTGWALAHT